MGTVGAKVWTYEEYRKLDDEKRYEVLEGELRMAPTPDPYHQDVSRELELLLVQFVGKNKLGKVYYAPIDVVFDQQTVLQPDIIFISNDSLSKVKKNAVFGAPDLVVEIISPSSVAADRYTKRRIYERFGVREYWIVDPENRTIEVLLNNDQGFQLFSFAAQQGKVTSHLLEGFEVDIASIMEPS